jgi:predicted ATPase
MISSQYVSRVTLQRDKVDSFDRYPFFLPAVRSFDQIDLHSKVTYFVGENGSGKSTLLEAIAVSLGFNAEGGSKNFRFGTRRSHSELHEYLRVGSPRFLPIVLEQQLVAGTFEGGMRFAFPSYELFTNL